MNYCWRGRPAISEDGPAIVELFNEVFHGRRSISHWKWKFLDNPCGKVCIFVAQDGNRIVGQHAVLPTWMNLYGEKVMGGQCVDIMTHPDYRRQGVFVTLARQCFDQLASQGIRLLYVLPNEQSYWGFVNRLGWYDIGNLPKLVKILNLGVIIGMKTGSAAIAGLFEKLAKLLLKVLKRAHRPQPSDNISIRSIDIFDDYFDSFWKRINNKTSIGVWRDSKYMNWRYLLCPEKQYTVLAAEENGTLVGLSVLKCGVSPGRMGYIGHIVDFFCLPEKVVAAELLINADLEYLKEKGMAAVICHMFEHSPFYRLFIRQGFFRRRISSRPFVVRPNVANFSSSKLLNRKEWYVVEGDTDIF